MKKKSLCLIPAKGSSIRLPRKNILPLNGKPLIVHTIKKAINSKLFDKICVSTEDNEIANISKKFGADVPFLRPLKLSRDPSTIVDVMIHAINFFKKKKKVFEKITVLLPTSPFLELQEIIKADKLFENSNADTLLSVTPTEFPPFNAWIINDKNKKLMRCFPESKYKHTKSTECPKTYRSNGAILISNVKKFVENNGYQNLKIIPYVMSIENSLDIDTKYDYKIAELLNNSQKLK